MIYKVFIVLVIFKMASSLPDSSVSVNVNVDADSDNGKNQMYACPCENIHGQCVDKSTSCPDTKPIGIAGPPCKDPTKRCCYPGQHISPEACLATYGCIFYYPASQCFCMVVKTTAGSFNWTDAREECKKNKWLLPHPNCAVGVRNIGVQHFGDVGPFWTSAMYDDKQANMVWEDTWTWPGHKAVIKPNNPLIKNPPGSFAAGQCLSMSASYATMEDGKPYSVKNCNSEIQDQHHILCLKVW